MGITAVVSHMVTIIPGGWPNISGLHVTTTKTTSIPLFVSTTSADKVELPPDVKIEKRLIASGDPGLIGGDDDDDEEEDEGEGMVHVFDDGSIKIEGEDDEEDEENQVSRRKRKKKKPDTKSTTPPTPTTVNGETTTSSEPAKKRRKKKSKKAKTNIAKTDDQAQPTEQPKSEGKTPIKTEAAAAAAKKMKKSPAQTNGNAPAVNNIKTEKVASTKGPLSKKPRLK